MKFDFEAIKGAASTARSAASARARGAAATARRDSGPVVETTSGQVRGKLVRKGTIGHYFGIPYAAAPVGELRWAPPAPVEPWTGIRPATKPGPIAFQRAQNMDEFIARLTEGVGLPPAKQRLAQLAVRMPQAKSEDCLTVNVRTPAHASGLPVMVWIHGGDHTDGSSNEVLYNSDALPARGCVLVTINYRLGLMGFFAHPDLDAEGGGVSGNYGLLDQIAALEWVRDNIANFGGDPGNVTIFGESAGGQAVLNLMTAPRARGLFHRAISQSPSDTGRWLHHNQSMLEFLPANDAGRRFADVAVGADPGQLARLRAMDPDDLYELYREHPSLGRYFYPCVDGEVLPETPMTAFSHGRQAPVPLLIGYNADEASLFGDVMHPAGGEFELPAIDPTSLSPTDIRAALLLSYGAEAPVEQLLELYPGLDERDPEATARHGGDHMFGVHVDHASRCHAAAGHPVFRYHFRALPASPDQTAGAFHAAEITYVFDSKIPLFPVADDAHLLTREMGDRWFAFAATGDPAHPGYDAWPAYDQADPSHMVFDRPTSGAQSCPAQPGLDLMRARIDTLNTTAMVADGR